MNIKLAAFELVAMGNFNFMSLLFKFALALLSVEESKTAKISFVDTLSCFSVHLPVFFYFTIGYVMNIKLAAFQLVG